ncbi:MAG: Cof-type HAD-IIB family hydrolase [Firmicutes bacterium]|nr:Cof-type HAD-IIB family hydrolase [Bacillota bacterium]
MKKYAIFTDADGTLIATNGKIPSTTIEAITLAKENHYIFLSTGRCMAEISDKILSLGFDGIIASGGCYVKANNKILRNLCFSIAEIDELLAFFNANDIACSLESANGLYVNNKYHQHIEKMAKDHNLFETQEFYDFSAITNDVTPGMHYDNISKISFMASEEQFAKLKALYNTKYDIIDSSLPDFKTDIIHGEICLKNINKASAMDIILQEFNIQDIKTFALGDSENDLEMIRHADIGIAMGNANDKVKKAADYISDHVNNDGFYQAFKHFELI